MAEILKPVVAAVAEPRPDGERITRAVLEFPGTLPDVDAITVVDRTITDRSVDGSTVTLTLSEDDEASYVIPKPPRRGPGGPGGPGGPSGPGGPGGHGGPPRMPARKRKPVEVEVVIPGVDEPVRSTRSRELVLEDFVQGQYKSFGYNLYTPKNREEGARYPLVLFIPDASANGQDTLLTLTQGIGGTIWAEPAEQAKRPCYVLALQVPNTIRLTNDDFVAAPEIVEIKELLDKVIAENAVDPNRVYTTGQSQGCMASCELNCRYPGFFAASLLVSGQWDPVRMGQLTDAKFFIGLSEGGPKEFPGMNAITAAMAENGVPITRVRLNFRDGFAVNDDKVRAVMDGAQVIYASFEAATAFPDDGVERSIMSHHSRGWELTYQMESAREWLFAQKGAFI